MNAFRLCLTLAALAIAACESNPDATGLRTPSSVPSVSGGASAINALTVEGRTTTPTAKVVLAGRPRLSNGAASPRELVERVLRGLAERDTAALTDALVDREEWLQYLYPEFGLYYPAAKDTRPEVREFLWQNHSMSTAKSLLRMIGGMGGHPMKLEAIRFDQATETFNSYAIHQGTVVEARSRGGAREELRCLGSIVEMDGVYKLLSYRDRE